MSTGIGGKWRGTYLRDGKTVGFRMTLRPGRFGFIKGESEEDPLEGIPEGGKIRGRFSRGILRFKKLIAHKYVLVHGRYHSYNELYFREHGRMPAVRESHPAIEYEGTLSDDGIRVSGTWRVKEKNHITGEGEWSLERMH